jgi:rubrerythrin
MSTQDNLQAAFAGESQANRKYLAFAKKAETEGFPQVAKLFRAAAEAETIHAHAHLRVMNGVKSTLENLKAASEGEGYEFKTMYPEFVKVAEAEKSKAALNSFKNAMATEKIHHELYNEAIAAMNNGKDVAARKVFVCKVCGNTVYGEAQDKCSICGASKNQFFEVA